MNLTSTILLTLLILSLTNSAQAQCWLDDHWYSRSLPIDAPKDLKNYFFPLSDRETYELKNLTEKPIYLLSNQENFYDKSPAVLKKIRPFLVTPTGKVRTSKLVNGYEYVFDEVKMDWEIRNRERFEIDIIVTEKSHNILFNAGDLLPEEKKNIKYGPKRPKNVSIPKIEIKDIFIEKEGKEYPVGLKVKYSLNEKYLNQKICIPCFLESCAEYDESYRPKELRNITLNKSTKNILNFFGKKQMGRLQEIAQYLKKIPRLLYKSKDMLLELKILWIRI